MLSGEQDLGAALPLRLKELRLELGWTLDDVVERLGLAQRGVASNWEATNQRRRTPPLATLLTLQKWYGVSMDYLLGNPHAERDSPDVKVGKKALRAALLQAGGMDHLPPSDRARCALAQAVQVAPEAFFDGRIAAFLLMAPEDYEALKADRMWPDSALERLSHVLGINRDWFFAPKPAKVLEYVE